MHAETDNRGITLAARRRQLHAFQLEQAHAPQQVGGETAACLRFEQAHVSLPQGVGGEDEARLQLRPVQLSHCMWGLHVWDPRGSDPNARDVTATDPVPGGEPPGVALSSKDAARIA